MRLKGWDALQPAVIAGVFTLAGGTLGFIGAIAVEFVRGRSDTKRDAASRRERFQVETLTRAQDVARDLFEAVIMTREINQSEVRSGSARADELVNCRRRLLDGTCELSVLVSRVHDREIRHLGERICTVVAPATDGDLSEADGAIVKGLLAEAYWRFQQLAGHAILGILDARSLSGATGSDEHRAEDVPTPSRAL